MIVLGARSRSLSFIDARKLLRYGFSEVGLALPPEPVRREVVKKPSLREAPKKPIREVAKKPMRTRRATSVRR
jgi:hypothetical protein